MYACDDEMPPPGYFHIASGPTIGSGQMFVKVLQAVMQRDTAVLSKRTWEISLADALKPLGIKMCRPRVRFFLLLGFFLCYEPEILAIAMGELS